MYAILSIDSRGKILGAVKIIHVELPTVEEPEKVLAFGKAIATEQKLPEALVPGFLADLAAAIGAFYEGPGSQDFAVCMCLQYQLLPESVKAAREDIVVKAFERHLDESWKSDLPSSEHLDYYMRALHIMPEAVLEDQVHLLCMFNKRRLVDRALSNPHRAASLTAQLPKLQVLVDKINNNTKLTKSIRKILADTACSRPISTFPAFAANAEMLLANKLAPGFFALVDKELTKEKSESSYLCAVRQCDAFELAMEAFLKALPAPAQYIDIGTAFFRAREAFAARLEVVKRITVDAVRSGIYMGSQTAKVAPRLLATVKASDSLLDAQVQPAYMRPKQPQGRKTSESPVVDDPDARALWPVSKLAEWIDGPIGAKAKVDQKALLKRLQAEQAHPASQGADVGTSTSAPQVAPSVISESQIARVIQDALKRSSEFFLGDAQEMLERANALQIDEARRHELAQLCDELRTLCASKGAIDEEHARTIFMRAETLGDAVRQAVKVASASQKFQSEFGAALMDALAQERIVFGKCSGGRIACEAQDDDWGFAVENFHNRWLPDQTVFAPDGIEPLELGADQAMAFYVTGSSKSGYAFDVSVHLWRRRQGSQSPPGTSAQYLAPMNRETWFDEFLTCIVLHVPKRQLTTTTTTTTTTSTGTAGRGRGAAQRGRGSRK